MTKLRTIAKAGIWEVIQDTNGVVSIRQGDGDYNCNYSSAYEAIRAEVKDPAIRTELLNQWSADRMTTTQAEAATPIVEKLLGRKMETKDLVEELGS